MAKETKVRAAYSDDMWRRTNAALAYARRAEAKPMSITGFGKRAVSGGKATLRRKLRDADAGAAIAGA